MKAACAVNELLLNLFDRIVADLDEKNLYQHGAGHGHSPVWLLGHLTIAGEMGLRMLGGKVAHREWLSLFGPGSTDHIDPSRGFSKSELAQTVRTAYSGLRELCGSAPDETLDKPHNVGLFKDSPLQTVRHFLIHLLTSHFSFHVSQLSGIRRESGFPAIF